MLNCRCVRFSKIDVQFCSVRRRIDSDVGLPIFYRYLTRMNDNVLPCAERKGRTTFFPVLKSGTAINGWPAAGTALSFFGRGTVSARATCLAPFLL